MCRITWFLVALCLSASVCCFAPQADSAVLNAEVYAFYSSLYRNSNGLVPGETVGIAAEPMAFPSPLCALKPSTEEEQNMVKAAQRLRPQGLTWKRQFDFGHPYLLIPPAEVVRVIDCIGQRYGQSPRTGCEPYAPLRFVRFFSLPVFNSDHTRALVALGRSCGGLCGNGSVQVYRNTRDGWKEELDSFARCGWIS